MSQPRLRVSPLVIERLNKIQDWSEGVLFGINDDTTLSILGFCITSKKCATNNQEKGDTDINFNHNIIPNLPANVNIIGSFIVCSTGDVSSWENNLKNDLRNIATIIVDINTHGITTKLRKDNKFDKTEYELLNDYWKSFVHFNLNASVTLSCVFDYDSVQDSFSTLKNKINQGVAFQIKDSKVFILEKCVNGFSVSDKTDVNDLKSALEKGDNDNIIQCSMFLKSCCDSDEASIAPVIKYEKKSFKSAKIILSINTLAVVNPKTKVSKLYEILLESVRRSVSLNEDCLLKQHKPLDPNKISIPQIYHFFPRNCGHFITIAYPKKLMEDQLVSTREIFHKILSLPVDIPMFRRGNVFTYSTEGEKGNEVPINPHEGLKPSGVQDGEISLVQGTYGYHHYMQDNFDDSGWGCAYRSLQTIFSWFRHQGFTSKPIPTHKDIQQCLVDIGDKPSSFVGSKNWIGSTEVSFVLETLLSVSSRIVSVSSGEELSMKGSELSHHFKTQGTPIMIGGGVLAHTILGVDYNRKTGALKFLILDPHYTGADDLETIQSKGWCGWKGMDFWKKNAFYNMCLPLRPKSI